MKVKLFLAALCLFLLPLFFAPSSSQFSAYACSGYLMGSGACCECGSSDSCICGDTRPASEPKKNDPSLGSESLIVLAVLMLWLRIRAN